MGATDIRLKQMSSPALVSVVVPTFRRVERLPSLLAKLSVIDQACDLDVAIIDQTPGADLSKLQGFSEHFACLRFISLAQANVSRARNIGANAASCDILLFLDDDMELERSYIPRLLSLMREKPQAAWGATWPQQGAIGRADGNPLNGRDGDPLIFLPTCALAMHKQDFMAAGGFDERLDRNFEDAEFSHRLKQQGLRLVRHPDLQAQHHNRQENGTWYRRSLMEAAARLMRQTAYFRRKTGRSWPGVLLALLRVIASEARHPGYLRGGTPLARALTLGLSLPAAVIYAARPPLLIRRPDTAGKPC